MKKISKGASSVKIPGPKKDTYMKRTGTKRIATKKSSKTKEPMMKVKKMDGKMGIDMMGKKKKVPNLSAMKRRGIISSMD